MNFNQHIQKILPNKFRGSERKDTVLMDDGNIYLMKLPDVAREKRLKISYINNSISEYLGCKIMESIGLPVQTVILGEYERMSSDGTKKTYLTCACKDFTTGGKFLSEAELMTSGDDVAPKTAEISSFETIEKIAAHANGVSLEELRKFYAEMFVADALIGNTDRHNGNWGFLTENGETRIAPIYDCGSCLCPLANEENLGEPNYVKNAAVNAASVILDGNGQRIKYRDYLSCGKNLDVTRALYRLFPRIDMQKIMGIIEDTPYISQTRKDFYKDYLQTSYEFVLLYSIRKIQEKSLQGTEFYLPNEILFPFHKAVLYPLQEMSLYETKSISLLGENYEAKKVHNQYICLIKDGELKALISCRSQSDKVKETLQIMKGILNLDVERELDEIRNSLKNPAADEQPESLPVESATIPHHYQTLDYDDYER